MSAGPRLPFEQALILGQDVLETLRPVCERVEIAGSLRRQKSDIGDVEIVAIPKIGVHEVPGDLFGPKFEQVNELDNLCAQMLADGRLAYRFSDDGSKHWGSSLKWGMFKGFALDIYSASVDTWSVTLLVRTGSAEFSHRIATPLTQMTSNGNRGLSPSHLTIKGIKGEGAWRLRRRDTGEAIPTPEEADVFRELGYEWLAPELRTDDAVPRLRRSI